MQSKAYKWQMQQVIFKAGKKKRNGMSESLIPPSSSSREASYVGCGPEWKGFVSFLYIRV
jgi:hypothetical protein